MTDKQAEDTKRERSPLGEAGQTASAVGDVSEQNEQEQLLDEARDVQLSESAIRKLPKNDSLLSRRTGKLTK